MFACFCPRVPPLRTGSWTSAAACVYSGLVHEKWKLRALSQLARLVPGAGDQFHSLLRHPPAGSAWII
jgi:hypothetical protein